MIRITRNPTADLTWAIALVAALGLAGCAVQKGPPEPDYSQMRAEVKTVALAPFRSATAVVKSEQVEVAFEQRVTDHLVRSGLKVIGPTVWEELWRRYSEDVGGVYDVSTGQADEQRFETVKDAVYRELLEQHGVDGMLYVQVRVVDHYGVIQQPDVCGRSVAPYWPAGWAAREKPGDRATLVRTACLVGVLVDPSSKEYFGRQAGLEVIETYYAQERAIRPSEDVLKDEAMLDQVTDIVLKPFERPAPDPEADPAAGEDPSAAPNGDPNGDPDRE